MCGITGYFSFKKSVSNQNILEMNRALAHRGPDDEGFWIVQNNDGKSYAGDDSTTSIKLYLPTLSNQEKSNIALGFRRLSILDLSENGHQPMTSKDGKTVITFNGEIYNFQNLRKELENLGYQFKSQTDTEVILYGYDFWKEKIFEKLDGMFAIAIADLEHQKIILARDRMGLKPLFYAISQQENIVWASEIKALLKAEWIKPKVNWHGVYTNFLFQTTLSPSTCFENIMSLRPGHWMSIDTENFSITNQQFWKLPDVKNQNISLEEAQQNIDHLLNDSVKHQLIADVKVASMMSGGIDSTLLTAKAKKYNPHISAFTISYQFSEQEVEKATLVANKLDIPHFVDTVSDDDIIKNLQENIQHFEEPYCSLEVLINAAKFAWSKDFKVVLSGNGADELFGGYEHALKLNKWRKIKPFNFLRNFIFTKDAFSERVKNYLSQDTMFDFFRQSQFGMRPAQAIDLFSSDIKKSNNFDLKKYHLSDQENYEGFFQYDMAYSLASHHVFRDDLSAMKYGIEFRYPYLSNDLIDYIAQLPTNLRYNGIVNKPLLRKVAASYLPEEVLKMPKKGFSFPLAYFLKTNATAKNFVETTLSSLKKRTFFNAEIISQWQNAASEDFDFVRLWQLVTFELWYQKYFEN